MRLFGKTAILVLTVFLTIKSIQCDHKERSVSTSVVGMEQLLELESSLIESFDNIALELEKKLEIVQSAVRNMRNEAQKAATNTEQYLSNPVNSFALIRRLQEDYINLKMLMEQPVGKEYIEAIESRVADMPSKTDLTEAISGIYRLQTTYDLQPADIARGLLNGQQYDEKLNALDCFAIGQELFERKLYYHASFWLYEVLQLHSDHNIFETLNFDKHKLVKLYAESFFRQNRPHDALSVIKRALLDEPNNPMLLAEQEKFETLLELGHFNAKIVQHVAPTTLYEIGCRDQYLQRPSRLHCRYNTTTSAFLRLAPLKMEELHLDPYVMLYHDVVSDNEIAELKMQAAPKLVRATVFTGTGKNYTVINTRTAKNCRFEDSSDVSKAIAQRIFDMTGFDLQGSDPLQVVNYGLGGHYEPHFDFFNVSETHEIVRLEGDRIATVLIYLSHVEQGGATVFPNIQTAVFPQKGTALVWYNLNDRGVGDSRTLHAACPVIVGSKWVATRWMRERSQIFRRPCNRN